MSSAWEEPPLDTRSLELDYPYSSWLLKTSLPWLILLP